MMLDFSEHCFTATSIASMIVASPPAETLGMLLTTNGLPRLMELFLGQNDLCMSMGLYEKYEFPHMYTSPELNAATTKLIYNARKNNKILGLFLFGTDRVAEFMDKGFTFISVVRPRLWLRCCLCWHPTC